MNDGLVCLMHRVKFICTMYECHLLQANKHLCLLSGLQGDFKCLFLTALHHHYKHTDAFKEPHASLFVSFRCTLTCSCVFLCIVPQIGERQHVLVTEESFDSQYYVAHNKFYEQVQVDLCLVVI